MGAYPCTIAGGEEIERWDAYEQPTGIHYNPYDDYQEPGQPLSNCFHFNCACQEAEWLDFQWCQTGHGGEHLQHKVRRMHAIEPVKAVANGEPTYEGMRGHLGMDWWQGEEAWMNVTAGGTMGVVYGAGSLWQWKLFCDEPGWPEYVEAPGLSWREALHQPGSRYPGLVGRALREYNFVDMTVLPDVGEYAVGKRGEFYCVYFKCGGSVRLHGMRKSLPYRWYDPRRGEWCGGGEVSPAWPVMTAPSREPWVLLVGERVAGTSE
ncbi:MAG: DUF4038 domain-containing protein [bacterium]|nr:DUF4038 domain-containing protein [bacterium]